VCCHSGWQIFPTDPPPSPFPPKASLKSRKGNYCRLQPPVHPSSIRLHLLRPAGIARRILHLPPHLCHLLHLRVHRERVVVDPRCQPILPELAASLSASRITTARNDPATTNPPWAKGYHSLLPRTASPLHYPARNDDWPAALLIEATISSLHEQQQQLLNRACQLVIHAGTSLALPTRPP
jgi:hypothetical protein